MRIHRRVDDSADTLVRLEALGAQTKESLAYSTGWVSSESAELGRIYNALVELLRAEVTISAGEAWARSPVRTGAEMNIGGPHRPAEASEPADGRMPAEWMIVQEFSGLIQHRIGWRRYVWIRPLLRRRLARRRLSSWRLRSSPSPRQGCSTSDERPLARQLSNQVMIVLDRSAARARA
ncbi:hypothetical protein [Kribbella flavida]|uniref:hypothetical protein n=1 Tax=Kribbella flavida TaxID=182640 RepID=UPI00019BD7B5|nr:hypothetical protein [Kribbella flavida]